MDWNCTFHNDFVINGSVTTTTTTTTTNNNNNLNNNGCTKNINNDDNCNEITLLYHPKYYKEEQQQQQEKVIFKDSLTTTNNNNDSNENTTSGTVNASNTNTNTRNNDKNIIIVTGSTKIIHATCSIVSFVQNLLLLQQQSTAGTCTSTGSNNYEQIINEIQYNRIVQIAICDYIARTLNNKSNQIQLVRIISNISSNTGSSSSPTSCEDNNNNNNNSNNNSNNTTNTSTGTGTGTATHIVIVEPLYKVTQITNNKHIVQKRYNRLLQQVVKKTNHNHQQEQQNDTSNYYHNDHNDDNHDDSTSTTSFVFERTDVSCCRATSTTGTTEDALLHIFVRCFYGATTTTTTTTTETIGTFDLSKSISTILNDFFSSTISICKLLHHIAIVITQEQIRILLEEKYNSIAFIANGSILPRKSSIQQNKPMSSPPAISFIAPPKPKPPNNSDVNNSSTGSSIYNSTIAVPIGIWKQYLNFHTSVSNYYSHIDTTTCTVSTAGDNNNTILLLDGLLIPKGITLIVGGGYHGKSTLLRCIACSIYNKIPGDGRELCVSISNTVTIRSEDGRYVNNCNISGFISNLPTAVTTGVSTTTTTNIIDTKHFSTSDASGSTSQSSNVIEAIEFGCTCMLLDEDTSATNFMARDGRMRSLIQNECITPLLYRVNGLYNTTSNATTTTKTTTNNNRKSISFIVVVGGVGDWLDVPHNVILINNYICTDVTSKAKSISKQFSHGHVQYGGQGVVHQLSWPLSASPIPRIPTIINTTNTNADCDEKQTQILFHIDSVNIRILDGTNTMSIHNTTKFHDIKTHKSITDNYSDDLHMDEYDDDLDIDDEDDEYDNDSTLQNIIDLSRCEQLLGKKQQLYGCGICVVWIVYHSQQPNYKNYSISQFLDEIDSIIEFNGFLSLFINMQQQQLLFADSATDAKTTTAAVDDSTTNIYQYTKTWNYMINNIGYCYRPRRYEIGQALTRLRNNSNNKQQKQIVQFITAKQIEEQIQQIEQEQILLETQRKEQLIHTWNTRKQKRTMKDTLLVQEK